MFLISSNDNSFLLFTNNLFCALPALRKAKQNGCSLALCDMAGSKAANKLGMNSILISSGTESITSAIDEAVKLVRSSKHVHKQKDLFQALLTNEEREFLIFNPSGNLWFSSLSTDEGNTTLMNLVQTYLKAFLKISNQTVTKQIRDKIYVLTNRHLFYENQKYTTITIQQKEALLSEEDIGITIYNRLDHEPTDFINEYSSSQKVGNTATIIEEYSKSSLPVLIIGEPGTGKDKVAKLLYENGIYNHAPLYIINCELMSDKKWNSIMNNANSPLTTTNSTIYIKNPGALSKNQLENLFFYIENSNLLKRNRLIFSLILNSKQKNENNMCRNYLENKTSCLTLKLPPLRERIQNLPSIATLYIHRMNVSTGKQIIGFEAEAMELMTAFSWPNNLDQLQHIIRELVIITKTPYITYDNVKEALEKEPNEITPTESSNLNLTKTLDEINSQIIQLVLKEENGNKEKTAKRLGISRSTLWRMLKNQK